MVNTMNAHNCGRKKIIIGHNGGIVGLPILKQLTHIQCIPLSGQPVAQFLENISIIKVELEGSGKTKVQTLENLPQN